MKKLFIPLLIICSTTLFAQDVPCRGLTKKGEQCRMKAKENGYCRLHNPQAIHCSGTTKSGKPCTRIVKEEGQKCFQHKN